MSDLATIVVNWNTVDLLDDCLSSIVEAAPTGLDQEIVVVDNASTDGSVDHLRVHWPHVRVIANATNEGFCRANNRAIRATDSPFVLLVNTDARLQRNTTTTLLDQFARDPRAGAAGPRLEYADGTFQRWTAGHAFDLPAAATYLLSADRLPGLHRRGLYLGADVRGAHPVGWVSSAVMVLRRSALDDVGPLDEDLFVYMDDVDLCERMQASGWTVWYAADTTAVHFMGGSAPGAPGSSATALRALNAWFTRRHGRRSAAALRALEITGFGLRAGLYGWRGRGGRSPDDLSAARLHLSRARVALEPT